MIKPENPCYIKLANSWIILNSDGAPTPEEPEVILEPPSGLDRVNNFLKLCVEVASLSGLATFRD